MKIIPSKKLLAHLEEQNVIMPEGGFDIPDGDYANEQELLKAVHSGESDEDFNERIEYRMIWKFHGIQQNGGATGTELQGVQKTAALTRQLVQIADSHLPNAVTAISQAVEDSSKVIHHALAQGHAKVESAILDLKRFEGESHAEVINLKSELHAELKEVVTRYGKLIVGALGGILFMLILIALLSHPAHGQSTVVRGASKGTTVGAPVTSSSVDANHTALDVSVVSGGGTGGGPSDAAPNAAASESDTARQKVATTLRLYDTGGSAGSQLVTAKGDQTSGLWVNCKTGCAGGSSTPSDTFANPSATAGLTMGFTMLWNGSTWDRVKGDTTNGLWVNCKNGCAGGSSTPSDTFANPTTAGLGMSFPMLWNGTSWDRWYGDKTNGAFVNIKNSSIAVTGTFFQATQPVSGTFWQTTQPVSIATLPSLAAGTAVIGHVIADSGSTTAVTGNVASTVADGANVTLGAKADAKSTATDTTAVTIMQVLKQISASVQAPPSQAVTNAGTFATQSTLAAETTKVIGTVNIAAAQTVGIAAGSAVIGHVIVDTAPTTAVTGPLTDTQLRASAVPVSLASAPTTAVTNQGLTDLDAAIAAVGAAAPADALQGGFLGSGATGGFLKGASVGDTYKNINISTATTTLLVTGVSGRLVRFSAIHMITAGANNVAFIEGTGATCGTGTAGMAGGTTAASGYNFAANGGMTLGSGLGTVMQTATTGDSVCMVTSAATQLSGGLQYTIY